MTQTARIYGDSLYDLAAEEALSERIMEESAAVGELFQQNPDYRRLLAEPTITKQERLGLLDQAFSGRIHGYLLNFLKILCERGILMEYEGCLEQYVTRYNRDHGIAEATVTSAVPLTESQVKALKEKLSSVSGKKILLKQLIKPSVIGGLKVELEGKLMDGTISSRLSGLHRKITDTVSIPE